MIVAWLRRQWRPSKKRMRRRAEDQAMQQYKAKHHYSLPDIPVTHELDNR